MQIKAQPMGNYQTNCYIVTIDDKDLIIDPGIDATKWVIDNVNNPIAILNTHGHFDHVWSNKELKKYFNIPIYIPEDDGFFLTHDPFNQNVPKIKADILVKPNEILTIKDITIKFHHFPGHTPGCSMIEIKDNFFSGDFIFQNSIGRYDFPFSNAKDMKQSLEKFLTIKNDAKLYPGHGYTTTIKQEQKNTPFWIKQM